MVLILIVLLSYLSGIIATTFFCSLNVSMWFKLMLSSGFI